MNDEQNFWFHQKKIWLNGLLASAELIFCRFLAIFGANSNFLEKRYYENFIWNQAEEVVKKSEGPPISCQGPFKSSLLIYAAKWEGGLDVSTLAGPYWITLCIISTQAGFLSPRFKLEATFPLPSPWGWIF